MLLSAEHLLEYVKHINMKTRNSGPLPFRDRSTAHTEDGEEGDPSVGCEGT